MSKVRDLVGATNVDWRLDLTVSELKAEIDRLSYYDLLKAWRNFPKNDPYFVNEIGVYFKKVMRLKREMLSEKAANQISDLIGKGRYRG